MKQDEKPRDIARQWAEEQLQKLSLPDHPSIWKGTVAEFFEDAAKRIQKGLPRSNDERGCQGD